MVLSVRKLLLVVMVSQWGKGGDWSLFSMKWLFCVHLYWSARSAFSGILFFLMADDNPTRVIMGCFDLG
jgi:exosortase/archaeosortase